MRLDFTPLFAACHKLGITEITINNGEEFDIWLIEKCHGGKSYIIDDEGYKEASFDLHETKTRKVKMYGITVYAKNNHI